MNGGGNAILIEELSRWSRADGKGISTDSSAGFVLASGARLAPDAAWISRTKFRMVPICPEFVVELLSPSDRPKKLDQKMREWLTNGVQLGWLLDPKTQSVTIYRPNQEPEVRAGITQVKGEGPIDGFVLDLVPIWTI